MISDSASDAAEPGPDSGSDTGPGECIAAFTPSPVYGTFDSSAQELDIATDGSIYAIAYVRNASGIPTTAEVVRVDSDGVMLGAPVVVASYAPGVAVQL